MAKKGILIIEDDPDIQDMLAFAMQNEGWRLIMASSGEEGFGC